MKNEQFKPFIISPCYSHSTMQYTLEDGLTSFDAEVIDNLHFECDSPCLALVDCEVVSTGVKITEVHLIATNVDKMKLLSWLKAIQANLIGYLIILIGLITKVRDNQLRSDLVEIIFHNQLHPAHIFKTNSEKMNNLYPSLIIIGQKAFLKCQYYSCTQTLRDTLLVSCLLKKLAKNELIVSSPEYEVVKALIEEKLTSLNV
ncbi:hypothetical protein [Psychromonas antarctica]|uniref:hypothetical protein n=1 Tax=Psychromonas antarctica TaxID=67573 RepID=UPI001EE91FE6|nr:hypothetical protein [Psychromonas antarctica]MCG6202879.1 hypothetical protein [Psychromonas antarctica]